MAMSLIAQVQKHEWTSAVNGYSCARNGFWISSEPSVGLMRVIVGPLNTAKPSFLLLS